MSREGKEAGFSLGLGRSDGAALDDTSLSYTSRVKSHQVVFLPLTAAASLAL